MVLGWIVATIVIIGVGSSLAGEYNADYNTPGSESKAASVLTEERFGGYSGQEIYVVWKDPAGAESAAAKQRVDAFLAKAQKIDHIAAPTEPRISQDGKIGSTTLPLTVAGWDIPKESGEKLIAAAEENSGDGLQIKLGGDPIYAAQEAASPEGLGFLGAAIVLLIAFGSVVAAGLPLLIALVRPRHLLRWPDRAARQRRRRPRLDDGGVGPDRDRGRDRLRAARPDALPRRAR